MKTKLKSRLYFLNKPASRAIHGIDCDMTRAEWIPTILSAARAKSAAEKTNANRDAATRPAASSVARLCMQLISSSHLTKRSCVNPFQSISFTKGLSKEHSAQIIHRGKKHHLTEPRGESRSERAPECKSPLT